MGIAKFTAEVYPCNVTINHSQDDAGVAPDNIHQLADEICANGNLSAADLETKRKVAARVNELIVKRLTFDVQQLEQSAIVGDHPIEKRHSMMGLALALRQTITWIAGPTTGKPNEN